MSLTLNQTTTLFTAIQRTGNITTLIDFSNYDECWDKLRHISEKDYKYLYALTFNNKIEELKNKLIKLNFKQYDTSRNTTKIKSSEISIQ